MKKFQLIIFTLLISTGAWAQDEKTKTLKRLVPIRIYIETEKNFSGDLSNVHYLQTKLLDELRTVPRVEFIPAGVNEKPEVTFDIKVSNFTLSQRDEKTTTRTVTAPVEIGKDSNSNAITQTVAANVQNTTIKRRANAHLESTITIQGDAPFSYNKVFPSSYIYSASTTSISGDLRAVGNSFRLPSPGSTPPEPLENEFLFLLAKKDMMGRVIDEFKRYYQSRKSGE